MMGKSLTLIGTALSLALTTNIAVAESSKSPIAQSSSESTSAPTEIKMSPEGMKILCEYFPLNSRCPGGTALTPSAAPGSTTAPAETTPSTAPGSTTVPAETTPSNITPPDSTPAPGSVTPPDSGTPQSTPAPGTTPAEPGAPSNLTPAPGTVTPSEPGAPTEPGANSPSTPSTAPATGK